MIVPRYTAWVILFLSAAAFTGGCASTTGGQKIFQGFEKTRVSLSNAQQQVDTTLATMNNLRLTDPDNLSNAFRLYKDAVDQLEQQGIEARSLARTMNENMDTNIMDWQKEMETIQDPTVKSSVESRKEAVKSNFKLVRMYADDVRKAYDPFLQNNKDMVKALSIDLSPAQIASLAPAMQQATTNGQKLKQQIAKMQRALDNIAAGQSPTANAPS